MLEKRKYAAHALVLAALATGGAAALSQQGLRSLKGSWIMDSAFEIRTDGARITTYGEHPRGLLIVDANGRYSLQIFRIGRPNFASGEKLSGTNDEYRLAVLGSSTHFGHVSIDRVKHQLLFDVEAASYPNWEGKRQVRDFTYENGLLHYAVPASASGNGTVAHSIWRRVSPG